MQIQTAFDYNAPVSDFVLHIYSMFIHINEDLDAYKIQMHNYICSVQYPQTLI